MKLTPAKIKEAAAWVEQHGLHPQPCGASVGDYATEKLFIPKRHA